MAWNLNHFVCSLRLTFYVIQRNFEIMHNLYPNPKNYSGNSLSHILKYFQRSSLTNCHIWGLLVSICGFKGIKTVSIKPLLSTYSYNIRWSCTTSHNTTPHVYIAQGCIGINNVMILFHISITKSKLHKQFLTISIRMTQKDHIFSTFTPIPQPFTSICGSMGIIVICIRPCLIERAPWNNHGKRTFSYSFLKLMHYLILNKYFQIKFSLGSQVNLDTNLLSIMQNQIWSMICYHLLFFMQTKTKHINFHVWKLNLPSLCNLLKALSNSILACN